MKYASMNPQNKSTNVSASNAASGLEYCEHGFLKSMCANCIAKDDHKFAKKMKHFQPKKRTKHPKAVVAKSNN